MTAAPPRAQTPQSELPNLDILRAFAVLLVALSHLLFYSGKGNWSGWMGLTGVCLFFVHTCLVLMWSLERDPHPGRFYLRRIFRLFPLWLIVLALVVTLRIPIAPAAAPHWAFHAASAKELLANATMTYNLWFGAQIVGASWSLPMEAQMYLLLPVLFFFVRSTRALWVLVILDLFVIGSVWAVTWPGAPASLAVCIPFFLPGVMAYALTKTVRQHLPAWSFIVFLLVMATIHHRFGNLPLSAFFCLAVGLALPHFEQVTWKPAIRAAHLIARYSYGIYLCHIPALCVGLYYLRNFPLPVRALGILATVTLAPILLYHSVEAPMIRLGSKLARKIESGPEPKPNLNLEPAP